MRDGHLLLIDVAFAQVRPSPWRQAVDLANMMLVLAVRTDRRPRATQRALQFFTPDEIAEAFAAARGVASPTQLRTVMKQDGRDLLAQFRALAPPQPTDLAPAVEPVPGRTGGLRRALLVFSVQASAGLLTPAHDLGVDGTPTCGTGNLMILSAQSVPSARQLPCIASIPAGWELGGVQIDDERTRFWLNSDVAGDRAVEVTLLPPDHCSVAAATEVPSDEVGVRRYERVGGAAAQPAQHADLPVRGRLRHLRLRLPRRADRVAPRRRRQRVVVPTAPRARGRGPAHRRTSALCGAGAAVPGRIVMLLAVSVRRRRCSGSWSCSSSRSSRPRCRCGCSASAAAGAPR